MSTGQQAAPPRRRMPRAEREAVMLAVATDMFGELGYRAASMDEIAARVGVSKPMLYHYFGSKERLFLACLSRARGGMQEAIITGAIASERAVEQLYGALVAWFRYIDDNPSVWMMFVDESVLEFGEAAEEIEAIRADNARLIGTLISAHAPDGHTADPLEIEVIAAAITGVGERVTRWRVRNPGVSPERTARHLMQLLWLGLGRLADGDVWEPEA